MTNTLAIEETTSPVLDQLSEVVKTQVAQILEVTEGPREEEGADKVILGFSVPMPGVRYYTYL